MVEGRDTQAPVLVIDDDPQIRRLVWWTLEAAGVPVLTAADGLEAANLAAQHRPSVVILDLELRGYTGVDVAQVLRAICGRDLPLVLVGSRHLAASRARQVRGARFLRKPFGIDDLLEAVNVMRGAHEYGEGAGASAAPA